MEDALISPEGLMILAGAGLIDAAESQSVDRDGNITGDVLYVHTTSQIKVEEANTIILPKLACWSHSGEMQNKNVYVDAVPDSDSSGQLIPEGKANAIKAGKNYYNDGADIFVMVLDNGAMIGEPCIPAENGVEYFYEIDPITKKKIYKTKVTCYSNSGGLAAGDIVLVDYYVKRISGVKQIEITPDKFGGYYYLEASTLFRDEGTGRDLPAEFIIPKCKVQSNFTFTLASSGDPSTFSFTLDAFPDRKTYGLAA